MDSAQTQHSGAPGGSSGPRCRFIIGFGVLALLYLALAWRGAYLDRKVSRVDEQLAQAKLELWKLTRTLDESLAPEADPRPDDAPKGVSPCPPTDDIPCKTLPVPKGCAITELAGYTREAPVEAPTQRKVARSPDDI